MLHSVAGVGDGVPADRAGVARPPLLLVAGRVAGVAEHDAAVRVVVVSHGGAHRQVAVLLVVVHAASAGCRIVAVLPRRYGGHAQSIASLNACNGSFEISFLQQN